MIKKTEREKQTIKTGRKSKKRAKEEREEEINKTEIDT
jgi:hypothetical protein